MRGPGACLAIAVVILFAGIGSDGGAATLAPTDGRLGTLDGHGTTVSRFEQVVSSRMDEAGVAGLSVAILNDGRILYARQFGFRNADARTIPDDSTEYAAASLSKPVFAYLVLTLAGRRSSISVARSRLT